MYFFLFGVIVTYFLPVKYVLQVTTDAVII
jgi:hypothetical protein